MAEILAGLVLKEEDQAWLKREVSMLTDLFKESPVYEWMAENIREEEREKAHKQIEEERKRAEEDRKRALKNFQETVITLMARDFPKLAKLAKKQVARVEDMECLQRFILDVTMTRDVARAATLLADLDEGEQRAQS